MPILTPWCDATSKGSSHHSPFDIIRKVINAVDKLLQIPSVTALQQCTAESQYVEQMFSLPIAL